jgi:hypothetical protein
MKYLTRFLLLLIGFALTTTGLMMWRAIGFSFEGIWFVDNGYRPHALHLLILGLAMIPPSLWEIFVLEHEMQSSIEQSPPADTPTEVQAEVKSDGA